MAFCYNGKIEYDLKNNPTDDVLNAFGTNATPVLLAGGQNTSYLCGNTVIKPEENESKVNWISQTFSELKIDEIRIPQPIKANSGKWIYNGWNAHAFIEGETTKSRWHEKIKICRKFHQAIENLEKPDFIGKRTNPWEVADRMTWGDTKLQYGEKLKPVLSRLEPLVKPISLKSQIIHGDMTGNILFHPSKMF